MPSFGIASLDLDGTDRATLRAFVSSWNRHLGPVVFVGAGMSAFQARRKSTAPSTAKKFGTWNQVLADLRARLSDGDKGITERLAGADALRVAELYVAQHGRAALLDRIGEHVPAEDYEPGEAHHRLRDIAWSAVVTTNYDDLLERAFSVSRRVRRVVTDGDLTQDRSPGDILIIKMHGDLAQRESIVLAEEDYRTYEASRPGIAIKVRQLLTEHPLLFLGFSLSDPNFGRIDGWIRDTVGAVRLPAVSLVHERPLSSERTMWKARGIELIQLGQGEELSRVLLALAEEQRGEQFTQSFNVRVEHLEDDIAPLMISRDPSAIRAIAEKLGQIVQGAATDHDGGNAARESVRWFCFGWHNMRHRHEASALAAGVAPPPTVPQSVIWDALAVSTKRSLLMLALAAGVAKLQLENASLDIERELLDGDTYGLSPNDRGLAYFYLAKSKRELERTDEARRHIDDARRLSITPELRGQLTAEYRELLFQEGDALTLEKELQSSPDDLADVFARCRRGSDFLLLGDRRRAQEWYRDALARSSTGDEKYSALWGLRVASYRTRFPDEDSQKRDEELRRLLRSIQDSEQPQTLAALERIEKAGEALLDKSEDDGALHALRAYLEDARRLGWPHTPTHEAAFPIETAARQLAQLLVRGAEARHDKVERLQEALAVLTRYGLASPMLMLFGLDQVAVLSEKPATAAWFRSFAQKRPTLQRTADAMLSARVAGLPLLADDEITSTVVELKTRITSWLDSGGDRGSAPLIGPWWNGLVEHAEHLPETAAQAILDNLEHFVLSRRLAFETRRSHLSVALWRKQGFSMSAQAAESLTAAIERFLDTDEPLDTFTLRWTLSTLSGLFEYEFLDRSLRQRIATLVCDLLDKELAKSQLDETSVLNLVEFAVSTQGLDPARLRTFAERAPSIVLRNLNSSSLGYALWCTTQVVDLLTAAQRSTLLSALMDGGTKVASTFRRFGSDAAVARAIGVLASREAALLRAATEAILQLAEEHPGALAGIVPLDELSDEHATKAAAIAERALLPAARAKDPHTLFRVRVWLESKVALDRGRPFLEGLTKLLVADASDTRIAALEALKSFFSRGDRHGYGPERSVAWHLVSQMAEHDPDWRVRARAMLGTFDLASTSHDYARVAALSVLGFESRVALERRVARVLSVKLAKAAPTPPS